MKFTKESILKSLNSLTMPAWIKRVFQLIVDYIDYVASSINNKADLVDGKVPIEQLPSYVDDVVEFQSIISYSGLKGTIGNAAYKDKLFFVSTDPYKNKFVNTKDNTAESDWEIIDPEDGKIYINTTDNHSYRWTGSTLLDLDKDFSNGINTLNNIVKVAYIGIVNNLDDIAEGDQSNINQDGMRQLFSFLFNYKSYRNSYIEFENEDTDNRLCRIIDINGGKRQFTIYNNGALQTYKQLNTGGKYSLEKISDIPGYIYLDENIGFNNDVTSVKLYSSVPAVYINYGSTEIGYFIRTDNTHGKLLTFEGFKAKTYDVDLDNEIVSGGITKDIDYLIQYDDLANYKDNEEVRQELTNILAGDTVVLDYTQAGSTLDENTIAALKKASQIILLNDNTTAQTSKSIYTVVNKKASYLYFAKVQTLSSTGTSINYNEIVVNLSTSVWNVNARRFVLPYGCYAGAGYSIKNNSEVDNTLGRLLNANVAVIESTDLGTTLSSDKLESIKNATFLILDEGSGKTKIFVRGATSTRMINYICNYDGYGISSISLNLETNILSSISISKFDEGVFDNYKTQGGTKTNKTLMYKELAAQLTENTYVIDSSKLNTVLTDTEANNILNASTLIVTNAIVEGNVLAFARGSSSSGNLNFCAISNATNGSLTLNKIIYYSSTKKCSNIIETNSDPYTYYASYGGKSSNLAFNSINNFLFDNTFIIDKTLLNTTISDTAIQNGIKKANILVVKDSTDNSYVLYIKGTVNTDSHFFYNINAMISTSIDVKRIEFKTSTNLLSAGVVYFSSAFKSYQLGGGTKYTTESAFNAQFAKVIDMTVTQ